MLVLETARMLMGAGCCPVQAGAVLGRNRIAGDHAHPHHAPREALETPPQSAPAVRGTVSVWSTTLKSKSSRDRKSVV
jgi:hypothetical protein